MDEQTFRDILFAQLLSMRFHPRNRISTIEHEVNLVMEITEYAIKLRRKKCPPSSAPESQRQDS